MNYSINLLFICFILLEIQLTVAMSTSTTTKRILVTGGNKGIGKAICEKLIVDWNDTCVIMGCRNKERGEKAIQDIQNSIGIDKCKDRLELLIIDTSSTTSVDNAVKELAKTSNNAELYGIINNAGIGWGHSVEDTINTNYFGPRRVNDSFRNMLKYPGGRIVNIASASGPNFLQKFDDTYQLKKQLMYPWLLPNGIQDVDEIAQSLYTTNNEGYGSSKALLNAYTCIHAKLEPKLIINACTPGFIDTDLTAGYGAPNPPSKGAIPPCWLMMDETYVPNQPSGRYYGSDCIRSPIHYYRGPGDAPYTNDDDLVDLSESAKMKTDSVL